MYIAMGTVFDAPVRFWRMCARTFPTKDTLVICGGVKASFMDTICPYPVENFLMSSYAPQRGAYRLLRHPSPVQTNVVLWCIILYIVIMQLKRASLAVLELLSSHPNSCFVTHSGMSSIMEALEAGVPMVCVPQAAEQPYLADRVADQGTCVFSVPVRIQPPMNDEFPRTFITVESWVKLSLVFLLSSLGRCRSRC